MPALFFWRGDYYCKDMGQGKYYGTSKAYELNQNNELMLNLKPGEHVWAFTRRPDKSYVLAADLVVTRTRNNPPRHEYGRYGVLGDTRSSRYFDVRVSSDAECVIRSLSVCTGAAILGHSFRGRNGVRLLTPSDEQKLITFSSGLATI